MKFLIFLAIIPCIWAFNGSYIECPNENYCPVGKTCCDESDQNNCCEMANEEEKNKKIIPSFPSHFKKNDSTDIVDDNGVCPNGSICNTEWCCKYENATCCSNSTDCCPNDHKCCGTAPRIWCCKTKQRCAETYLYCVAGASSISSTLLSVIMMLVIAVSLKHF